MQKAIVRAPTIGKWPTIFLLICLNFKQQLDQQQLIY